MNDSGAIEVFQRPLPETRTPTLSGKWEARCRVGDKTYIAVSRQGASHALARTLVNDHVPTGAVLVVRTAGRTGALTTPAIGAWSRWTYSGEKRILWEVAEANRARLVGLRGD